MTAHKFRIAFCILCHKYTPVLEELIRILNVPGNEIFIHVDGKSRIQDFAPLRDRTGVHFLEPRTKVYWAGFSMVESTLRLFAETQNKNFHYIVLISGDTLPLCPISELRTFLHTAYAEKREFISTDPAITFDEANWVRLRHFFSDKSTFMRRVKRTAMKCFMRSVNPYFNRIPPLQKGSQWIAITHRLRDYFFDYLQTNPDYLQAFKYSHGADEIFFQTLLCNSPFADRNADYSLVYTDWSCPGAHPKTFTTDDLYPLSEFDSQNRRENPQSATLFARKFDDALDIARYRTIILGELQNQHNQNPAN